MKVAAVGMTPTTLSSLKSAEFQGTNITRSALTVLSNDITEIKDITFATCDFAPIGDDPKNTVYIHMPNIIVNTLYMEDNQKPEATRTSLVRPILLVSLYCVEKDNYFYWMNIATENSILKLSEEQFNSFRGAFKMGKFQVLSLRFKSIKGFPYKGLGSNPHHGIDYTFDTQK